MSWPHWIDELKDRFLADESSAFLLYGDVTEAKWPVEGERLDAANVLVRFLARSRPLVAVLRPGKNGALRFPTFADENLFDNLVNARSVVQGVLSPLSNREPLEALARVWLALNTQGTDQGYIITEIDTLLPAKRRRVDPLAADTPGLFTWPSAAVLRRSNNVVVFLTKDLAAVREELVSACSVIHVADKPDTPPEQVVALSHLVEDVATPQPVVPEWTVPQAPSGVIDHERLRPEVIQALTEALIQQPEEHRPQKLPVMEAVAVVVGRHTGLWEELLFSLNEDGVVVVEGTGAEAFYTMWQGDITLDAAAGMLLKNLQGGFSEHTPPDFDETALRALCKRIAKKIV